MKSEDRAILLISCPDQKGLTAGITSFVSTHNGNILHSDQHIDNQSNTFFIRIEWSLDGFTLNHDEIRENFEKIAQDFQMNWNLYFSTDRPRMAIFVSRHLHCLYDVLYRHHSGQLACEIPLIISNHGDAEKIAQDFNIEFHQFVITPETKREQEEAELALLKKHQIDLIVLARYHQIFTQSFIKHYPNRMINIHHSFLPAFAGSRPYAQAHRKGVKLIGATSHFVTEDLDEGPIIEQDTVRISHRDQVDDLVEKGEDLERVVFSRAISLALERKFWRTAIKP